MERLLFLGNIGATELIAMLVLAAPAIIWIMALVKLVNAKFKDSSTKIIWGLVVVFVPFLGAILYLIAGHPNRIKG